MQDEGRVRYNRRMTNKKLSHLDDLGKAQMVDVSGKAETERWAVACGEITLKPSTLRLISEGQVTKGNVLTVAQVAGIQAAKRTGDLIPLCHPLGLTHVDVDLSISEDLPGVLIQASAHCIGRTGVEMEALTAVAVAALTVYDMVKAVDKTARIGNIRLVEKHGGKSGDVVLEQE